MVNSDIDMLNHLVTLPYLWLLLAQQSDQLAHDAFHVQRLSRRLVAAAISAFTLLLRASIRNEQYVGRISRSRRTAPPRAATYPDRPGGSGSPMLHLASQFRKQVGADLVGIAGREHQHHIVGLHVLQQILRRRLQRRHESAATGCSWRAPLARTNSLAQARAIGRSRSRSSRPRPRRPSRSPRRAPASASRCAAATPPRCVSQGSVARAAASVARISVGWWA